MNIVLLVVDSLRAASLALEGDRPGLPRTPFLAKLSRTTQCFRRAYATECWTLPAHASMFTGLLPSAHQAHFQTMAYTHPAPTLAEVLAAAGFRTELIARNFVFDGTIPGITRGFARITRPLSHLPWWNPFALLLAAAKPRFRRRVQTTGFFHPLHRENRRFLRDFARTLLPADDVALSVVLERMQHYRQTYEPYFLFCNLYDVHAPYPPTPTSLLRPFRSFGGCIENLHFPFMMSCLGSHTYLRPGFRLSARSRRMLLDRYDTAIELMDAKLAAFWTEAQSRGLLDDTLLVVTSDHGEAFGEHGLYLHDASVYDTHLHVPLWVHHPALAPALIDDVVSTREIFGMLQEHGRGTILDPDYRAAHPIALAEHFYYPHVPDALPRFRQNLAAAMAGRHKVIARRGGVELYDLERDPGEEHPESVALSDFEALCQRAGLPARAIAGAMTQLRRRREEARWQRTVAELVKEPSPSSSPACGAGEEIFARETHGFGRSGICRVSHNRVSPPRRRNSAVPPGR